MTTAVEPLTIAGLLALPPLVPLWPTVGRALGLGKTATYQMATAGQLPEPIHTVALGRLLKVRTVDLYRALGLTDDLRDVLREIQSATASASSAA